MGFYVTHWVFFVTQNNPKNKNAQKMAKISRFFAKK